MKKLLIVAIITGVVGALLLSTLVEANDDQNELDAPLY
jgi:hypothetical protein